MCFFEFHFSFSRYFGKNKEDKRCAYPLYFLLSVCFFTVIDCKESCQTNEGYASGDKDIGTLSACAWKNTGVFTFQKVFNGFTETYACNIVVIACGVIKYKGIIDFVRRSICRDNLNGIWQYDIASGSTGFK